MKTLLLTIFLAFAYLGFAPEKKNVLIIGDSISIGYTPFVRKSLVEIAIVDHNEGNAQHTGTGLKKINSWLGSKHWDVIHFNWGLWDLCYRNPSTPNKKGLDKVNGKITFTPAEYEANLRQLVEILKKTKAKLIFATTTMVPLDEPGRKAGDDKVYNKIAVKIMKENGIQINDINALSYKVHAQNGLGTDNVHYNPNGYEQLARPVAEAIKNALKD
jgi:lysophospholipase L1-like esterase